MKKKINILLLLLACCVLLPAQVDPNKKFMNWWYFGGNAGLNFNQLQTATSTDGVDTPNMPTPVTGPLSTLEGCFSLSDKDGNLLMSSDGLTVYNKNNVQMDNGDGLLGGNSSSQSGIVIPMPGSTTKFYIVTVDQAFGSNGINYSIVDMSENGGLGKVITKNINLRGASFENIAAVANSNGTDYWLVNRTQDVFYVWALTESGFSSSPQTYSTSGCPSNLQYIGILKFSRDNRKLVSSGGNYCKILFYADFDPATGVISNIGTSSGYDIISSPYGVEFSPSGEYVYVGNTEGAGFWKIKYSDMKAGIAPTFVTTYGFIDNFQIGPDNKIYGTCIDAGKNLYVIMNPNAGGTDIRVFNNYLINNVGIGLPTFLNSVADVVPIPVSSTCTTYPSLLSMDVTASGTNIPTRLEWNFGDGSSVITVSYTGNGTYTQSHTYNTAGIYTVTVTPIKSDGTRLSAVTQAIEILDCPIRTNRMIRTNLSNAKHE